MRLPQNENLTCHHLGMKKLDFADVMAFEVSHPETGRGLELYLKQQAWQDEQSGLMRSYLVRFIPTKECVGYFSLKAGLVSINEDITQDVVSFDTVPAVELANLAVNRTFVQKHNAKGLGYMMFSELIVPFVKEHAKTLGICMLYLFALPFPKLIQAYKSYGFKRLTAKEENLLHQRLKPNYDASCIFMYRLLSEL